MNYQIISDSTVDLTSDLVKQTETVIVPLSFSISGETYKNDIMNPEIPSNEFFQLVKKGNMPKTSQINVADFIDSFTVYLEKGLDILYLSFSSALSGTYNSANLAKIELEKEYPDRKIIIIDSRAASMGEGLLLYLASNKKKEGMSINDLSNWIEENKLRIWHWFTVDDINHLKRGGRLTNAQAFFAKALKIKPVLFVDGLGRLIARSKSIGRKNAILKLYENMKNNYEEGTTVFISHGDCLDEANILKDMIIQNLKVSNIEMNYIGPVIGAHSGQGTIALFYLGKDKREVRDVK